MISIKNKKDYQGPGEYIGRPSPLGNPFQIGRDGDRKGVIEKYRTHLVKAIRKEGAIKKEFYRLLNLARNGDLTLICWCAPLACHGDVIKEYIMYQSHGDLETNLSPAAAALGGKPVKEIDRLELPIACFNLIFKGEAFRIAGRSYLKSEKTGAQKLRYLKVGGFTYLEQNPAKDSKWGKAARDGHKIMWIIQTGNKWVGRVVDGEVKKL